MHRKSDSIFGTLEKTLKTYNCIPEAKHNKQTRHKTTKKNYTSQKITNFQIAKLKNSKIPTIQKSQRTTIQNSKNPKVFTSTDSCICFGIFGFLDFRSRCLITVMNKWAKCAFLRVVAGVSIYIYICIYIYMCHILDIYIYMLLCLNHAPT